MNKTSSSRTRPTRGHKRGDKALLSAQIQQLIKNEILTCALEPGEQIASRDLAARYHAGITPVREALLQLAEKGWVRPIPRFGYIISPITEPDVRELYEAREAIEPVVARLTAVRASAEELERIVRMADDCTYQPNDPESYAEFLIKNRSLHNAIGQACGNRRLTAIQADLRDELLRLAHIRLGPQDSGTEMLEIHRRIAHALRARDADLAERAVREGIKYSRDQEMSAWDRLGHRIMPPTPWTI